jgi:hypothetical protein
MRIDRRSVYLYRALFGVGFVVLGAVTAYRVAIVHAPPGSKTLGLLLAVVMMALGGVRIGQYVRARRAKPP